MKIIRHTSVVVEKMVVLAERGEPALVELLTSEQEDWILDWHKGNKFVLKRERDYTVLIDSEMGT